ncbi:hypothetical protein, partial [Flavobacterium sp. BFFFF1]|uniref:hypothetical protein n=1 Tax=Flavobacterium sp. BFFFF1 TaxID=2015557 RepID=UPI0025BDF96A
MKNYPKFYFLLLIAISSCRNNSVSDLQNNGIENDTLEKITIKGQDAKYLLTPDKTDSLCINDIERGKTDLKNFSGVYVKTICFGCSVKPYETELNVVLKKKKFKLGVQELGCVTALGQTQGCYKGYVDLKMQEKYGAAYKEEIEKEAEKLFITNLITQ